MAAKPGQRVYLVRLALGDGVKNPLSLADFALLIKRKRKAVYDPSALSRLENGKRAMTTEDAEHVAAVDPKERGAAWVAFGDDYLKMTDDDRARARAQVEKDDAAAKTRDRTNDQESGS